MLWTPVPRLANLNAFWGLSKDRDAVDETSITKVSYSLPICKPWLNLWFFPVAMNNRNRKLIKIIFDKDHFCNWLHSCGHVILPCATPILVSQTWRLKFVYHLWFLRCRKSIRGRRRLVFETYLSRARKLPATLRWKYFWSRYRLDRLAFVVCRLYAWKDEFLPVACQIPRKPWRK